MAALKKALVLFGPTASGKTAVVEELFVRNPVCRAEIISADSMQVYRGMDIGTAKPGPAERAKIPHHLIDIRDPGEQFNAGEFVRLAAEACEIAASHGALPVISGGTGFYLKNLILGLPEAPPSDANIRAILKEELAQKGAAALMKTLAACDPASAGRIHVNDEYRLLRALEVFRLSGRPLSSYAMQGKGAAGIEFLLIGLRRDRKDLYRRIDERCTAMFEAGLPGEVQNLKNAGYTADDPGLKAIGYREFFEKTEDGDENDAKRQFAKRQLAVRQRVAQNSRHYAKRQMTYFASIPGVTWIDCTPPNDPIPAIRRLVEDFT